MKRGELKTKCYLFTLSKLVLCQVLGLSHSYGVWEKIHEYFGPRIKPHMLQMHTARHTVCLILNQWKSIFRKWTLRNLTCFRCILQYTVCLILNQWKSIFRKWTLRIDKFLEKELYFSLHFWQDTC